MAARTALTAVALTRDGGVNLGVGATPDATNGNIVVSPGPFKMGILVLNADSANHTLIVRAGGYAGVPTGAANSGYLTGQYQPLASASQGDLSIVCSHLTGGYTLIENLTTGRFTQADGSIWFDWSASTSMTVWVVQKPYL
jgi:hypothetical protein